MRSACWTTSRRCRRRRCCRRWSPRCRDLELGAGGPAVVISTVQPTYWSSVAVIPLTVIVVEFALTIVRLVTLAPVRSTEIWLAAATEVLVAPSGWCRSAG